MSIYGLGNISALLAKAVTVFVAGFVVFALISMGAFVYTAATGREFKFSRQVRGVVIKFVLPVALFVGRMFGLERDRVVRSFVAFNNDIVANILKKRNIESVLILLPHCIQLENCERKITNDIYKCIRCGKCDIKNLVEIAEKYNLNISVATGGTIARRIVKDTMPDMILAVACERDLLSGIQDTYPLPVFGVYNTRPNGPCRNTKVDTRLVEDVINKLNIKVSKK